MYFKNELSITVSKKESFFQKTEKWENIYFLFVENDFCIIDNRLSFTKWKGTHVA